jgi:HTH-type transcriptional regulator/antitoxin HigA
LARRADARRLARDATRAATFPYAALARRGWVEKTRETGARIEQLLRFFAIGSLAGVPAVAAEAAYRVARARHSAPQRPSAPALAAWLRKGEIEAATIPTASFNDARLREALPAIRGLTASTEEGWADLLRNRLARCGVALVVVPHLPGTRAHGATRWLTPRKALVQMSLRGRWADIFWFSLFHELGHLLVHGRTPLVVEWDDDAHDARESEADAFARDHLIAPKEWAAFLAARPRPSARTTDAFARRLGIAPGIVVGRLHHEERLPHSGLNDLRRQLDWPAFRAGGDASRAVRMALASR